MCLEPDNRPQAHVDRREKNSTAMGRLLRNQAEDNLAKTLRNVQETRRQRRQILCSFPLSRFAAKGDRGGKGASLRGRGNVPALFLLVGCLQIRHSLTAPTPNCSLRAIFAVTIQ